MGSEIDFEILIDKARKLVADKYEKMPLKMKIDAHVAIGISSVINNLKFELENSDGLNYMVAESIDNAFFEVQMSLLGDLSGIQMELEKLN